MNILDLREISLSARELSERLPRASLDVEGALEKVMPIIADVRAHGAKAVRRWTAQFDGVEPAHIRVPRSALQ